VLLVSVFLELGHFGWQSGRTILNADSVQYVDNAIALVDPHLRTDFSFRKPGYSLLLAGAFLLFGNLGWGAIALNHAFQALTPVAAYGLGRLFAGRVGGWLAAALTMARVLGVVHADRIMSEAPYTLVLTLAVLATSAAIVAESRHGSWWAAAGVALALAWLIRATAVAAIAAAVVTLVALYRREGLRCPQDGPGVLRGRRCARTAAASTPERPRGLKPAARWQRSAARWESFAARWRRVPVPVAAALALCLPIAAAVIFECSLNATSTARFRPGTGTAGTALYIRTRAWQGDPDAATASTRVIAELMPQHGRSAAPGGTSYGGATVPRPTLPAVWSAWHRARRQPGWDEWRVDGAMRAAAFDQILRNPAPYVLTCGRVFVRQILRLRSDVPLGTVEPSASGAATSAVGAASALGAASHVTPPVRPGAPDDAVWYRFWSLPHRDPAVVSALVDQMERAAAVPAPFADGEPLRTARYVTMLPAFRSAAVGLACVGSVWPGAALIACAWLGVHRRACGMVALMYVADAALISLTACSDESLPRFLDVWTGVDAAVVAAGLTVAGQRAWRWIAVLFTTSPESACAVHSRV